MSLIFRIILILSASVISTVAHAALSPLSFSIIPPIQFPAEDFSVTGARISVIWGQHRDVYGLDLSAIGNFTEQRFVGIGVAGAFNSTSGTTTILGLQAAGLGNINSEKTTVYGVQVAAALNSNTAESSVVGLQLAAVNLSAHTAIYGFQVGLYNKARTVYGFQIGIINMATDLHGLQIGLLNFHHNGVFTVAPGLNFGF